jgi:hypothetical protein
MLSDVIILVGFVNNVMDVGVVAYSNLCAQGRNIIATGTYVVLSFVITLPICIYFVYVQGYDLQSLVFALIVGYCLSSLVLIVFLLTSNWSSYIFRHSKKSEVRGSSRTLEGTAVSSKERGISKRRRGWNQDGFHFHGGVVVTVYLVRVERRYYRSGLRTRVITS